MRSRFEHTVGAVVVGLAAGAVASFIASPLLLFGVGERTGIIKMVVFGPRPEPAGWISPALIGTSIGVGGIVAWLVFWLLDKKIYPERGVRNSSSHTP